MPLEDAIEVANVLIATGRAIHPSRWVESMTAEAEAVALGSFGAWAGG